MTPTLSPHVVFHFVVEAEGLCPAEALADGLDNLQDIGGDGLTTAMVAIVVETTIVVDEGMLDGLLCMAGHVIIEILTHTQGHLVWLVGAEIGALTLSDGLMQGVHAGKHLLIGIDIVSDFPAQASFMEWTVVCVTDGIGLGFLGE